MTARLYPQDNEMALKFVYSPFNKKMIKLLINNLDINVPSNISNTPN